MNNDWCVDDVTVGTHCSPQLAFLVPKCQLFYLLRELSAIVVLMPVLMLVIIAADCNHADLKTVAPNPHQHVNFLTRGENMLDLFFFTNSKNSRLFRAPTWVNLATSVSYCSLLTDHC